MTTRIYVFRTFHGTEYKIPVQVWNSPEGIVARAMDNVFCREEDRTLLLLEVDEDPELSDKEMEEAKNAIWAAEHFET